MTKANNILYWIFTVLLALSMGFSAIMSFQHTPESAKMMQLIGVTPALMQFLAVLKILGIITVLLPGLPRLKEWAYAGFTFDVSGAIFLFVAAGTPPKGWAPILIFLLIVLGSYFFWRRKTASRI